MAGKRDQKMPMNCALSCRGLMRRARLIGFAFAWAPGIAFSEGRVAVYNWSEYIAPNAIATFEAETGIQVDYSTFESNAVLEARLLAGQSGFDVVVPTGEFLGRQIRAGVYQELDVARLSNASLLDPVLMEAAERFDPSNRHAVIYAWGTTGIGLNLAEAETRGIDPTGTGWELLFDPKSASEFEDCGIAVLDDAHAMVAASLAYLGFDPNAVDETALNEAFDTLAEIRPSVRQVTSSAFVSGLANGDFCLVIGYSGDLLRVSAEQAALPEGKRLGFVLPSQGAPLWMDMLAIPADAPNPDAAHRFIDHLLSPGISAEFVNEIRYPMAIRTDGAGVDPAIIAEMKTVFSPDAIRTLWTPAEKTAEYDRRINRFWTRWKSGR